jgi:hypothetical protein
MMYSTTCNTADMRKLAGGLRGSREFKPLVGIVNKTQRLDVFIWARPVIRLAAISGIFHGFMGKGEAVRYGIPRLLHSNACRSSSEALLGFMRCVQLPVCFQL